MPPHETYVEPYCGTAAVLLAKQPNGASETINDLNGWLTDFWRVLQDEGLFTRFQRRIEATPTSEVEYRNAKREKPHDPVEAAVALMVLYRQSRGGDPGKGFQTPSRRPRRQMNEHASAWLTAIDHLPKLHLRLKGIQILNRPALNVIRQLDAPTTLFYLDPPYLHCTRTSTGEYGTCEMSEADHRTMLADISNVEGKVMLSGYPSDLYDQMLADWNRTDFEMPNNAAGGTSKRRMTERLWMNF